ncbi:MAG TPA: protein kinase [Candidatus Acidoferrales bacterium]|nr:protein kinase [Candidatus Acidoferrales bacterium]
MLGETISHYRILAKIGAGGMGVVYRAHDAQLDRDVAIKVLPAGTLADDAARKQFSREALALARLNHPNVETVFEFNSQDGVDFLVLELIPGQPLSEKLKAGPLDEREILRLGMQLAEGLAAAHGQGVIHRDLKPGNLFVTPDGRLKILDFGLAKLRKPELDSAATRSLTESIAGVAGTVPYMSPEQLRGQPADARSDIYSAGAVLYEMSTGRRPHPQTQFAELMGAILHESPIAPSSFNPRVSPGLENAIAKSLEKDPARRYQSARELHAVLESLTSRVVTAAPAGEVKPVSSSPRAFPPSARWGLATAVFVIVGFLAAFAFNLGGIRGELFPTARALSDKDTIVLADFDNKTGDPVFDGTLRQGLSVQLEQSPFLSMISDDRIQQALQMMRQRPDAKLTPEIARDICVRTASAAILDGSIAQIGTQFLLTLKAVNCSSGETLASTEAQASDKNHVLEALGKIASDMRNKLGESLSTVQKFDAPLEQVTTSSLEALKSYNDGMKALDTSGDTAAIPFLKHAIELDPNFAVAYGMLGIWYEDIGEPSLAADYTRKAYDLRDRASEPEKYFISARYNKQVTGNIQAAVQACELWKQSYPRMWDPHALLSGAIYPVIGDYEKAVEEGKEAIRLEPDFSPPYALLMFAYIALNRLDDAKATYDLARKRKVIYLPMLAALYEIAFLQNDVTSMKQLLSESAGQPGIEDEVLGLAAETAAYSGHLSEARGLSRRAMDSAEQAGEKEAAATYLALSGLKEALFGNADEARRRAALALERSTGRDVTYGAALAFAYAGDRARAQALTDDLATRFPEDTIVQYNFLPTLRAIFALSRETPLDAIDILRAATPGELGETTFSVYGWTAMYPVYVRGEAYLAAHQGREAAAEFQKILDHPGVVLNEPIAALAHLGLARAYALEAQSSEGAAADAARAKARAAYQDFLTLWKDADPDIPVLRQAKAEYAKLR